MVTNAFLFPLIQLMPIIGSRIYTGEMYYGAYSDIFSSLPANCFIRKPIENEELMNRIMEIIVDDTATLYSKQTT